MGIAYAPNLAPLLEHTLVQVQLSSSYSGYGTSCLDRDAEELRTLARYLKRVHGSTGICLVGFSTGCQIVTRYMQQQAQQAQQQRQAQQQPGHQAHQQQGQEQQGQQQAQQQQQQAQQQQQSAGTDGDLPPVLATVLHSAISDRESLAAWPGMADMASRAEAMVADGRGEDIVGRLDMQSPPDPITASRLLSLYQRRGDDDMFSSDLSDDELREMLSPLGATPCLLLQAGTDQYVPSHVDISALAARLAAAAGGNSGSCRFVVVPGAQHSMAGHAAVAAQHIRDFLADSVPHV
ncbi:hypothetical protein FOA52_001330 [Chlamydomonas sp. UWO 241]|nr:hypothetical protein FOA52_001330 [Chlamydomonas sp. UWO 241]